MLLEGLIPLLIQAPLWAFAIIIGSIVSLDVGVVELTRDYQDDKLFSSRRRTMMLLHGGFHAGSFLIYMLFIYAMQSLMFLPFTLPFELAFDLPPGLATGLLALFNFFIVCFVWWTYKSKIKEDHSEKNSDDAGIDRRDMRFFVDCVRGVASKFGNVDKVRGVAVAGAVAVDMLAVSAFLKNVLLPNNQNSPVTSWFRHECFDFREIDHRLEFLNVFADLTFFAVIVFIVVCIWVVIAQSFGKAAREYPTLVILLRIAEPLAVFYILAGVFRLTAQSSGGLTPQFFCEDVVDFVFAVTVVFSLFLANGISWGELKNIYSRRSRDNSSSVAEVAPSPWRDFKALSPALGMMLIVLIAVVGAMWVAYTTNPGPGTHNHLVEATGYIAWILVAYTIVILYTPSKWLDEYEIKENEKFRRIWNASSQSMWLRISAITLALGAYSGLNYIVLGKTIVTTGIVIWSVYIVLGWVCFDFRRWRFTISKEEGRQEDASYAELIAAVGLVSSGVAFLTSTIVNQLVP